MGEVVDVAVVGGGLAGLTVAGLLGGSGRRVTVLEAAGELGGRGRSTGHDGYRMNLGPRALYRGPLRSALRRLGVSVPGAPPPLGQAMALFGGAPQRGFITVPGLLTTGFLTLRERSAMARLFAMVRRTPRLAGMTAAEWLAGVLPTERARLAAASLVRIAAYLDNPGRASADMVAEHLAVARFGVRYVHGGWQTLVDGLIAAAGRRGVEVITGARVVGVHGDASPYPVALADGRRLVARAVVLAGLAPARALRLAERPELAAGLGPPVHAACLDVALRRLPDPRRIFLYGVDQPVYLVVHSARARFGAGAGAVVHLLRYGGAAPAPPAGPATGAAAARSGPAQARAELEGLLDAYQPGWRAELLHARFLPRITVTNAVPLPGPGLNGRPEVSVPGRPGVFLAGDWVGPDGFLADAVGASAQQAATAVGRFLAAAGGRVATA
ncbi:MAG TPA: FAD-dependent oxidoreductase [Micromonosporaceae bacterium]|nr:FAD-dependent oxidoreductase [Micromonosporaceae bacterium]